MILAMSAFAASADDLDDGAPPEIAPRLSSLCGWRATVS